MMSSNNRSKKDVSTETRAKVSEIAKKRNRKKGQFAEEAHKAPKAPTSKKIIFPADLARDPALVAGVAAQLQLLHNAAYVKGIANPKELDSFAKLGAQNVQVAVAKNSHTSAETLNMLADEKDGKILWAISERGDLSDALKIKIIDMFDGTSGEEFEVEEKYAILEGILLKGKNGTSQKVFDTATDALVKYSDLYYWNVLLKHPELPLKSVKTLIVEAAVRDKKALFGSVVPGGNRSTIDKLFKHSLIYTEDLQFLSTVANTHYVRKAAKKEFKARTR